ncbi:VIT1/CCC1 transporter family protein [Erythrobacter ani]|uniref:VIT1/CCC1 transporter family protein n=1 Tax=Erythrobacter ani TaxID=2827235 RepID=A0ABS6SKR8_9SPHN|nr:VIT1/CCC1 transporter family protein [Erythrobacter ani]MBV7265461.1 VIT1/CCC1 transporter family protein [Erythrobacter ani]
MVKSLQDHITDHSLPRIRERLAHPRGPSPLGDFMLGGVDGVVTTFAVVAGSAGGQLPAATVIILGIANLIADGFSMAVSNYLGTRARQEEVKKGRQDEEDHIRTYPEGERREIREIFARKGLQGTILEKVVDVVTADRKVWVDTMMVEELRLDDLAARPIRAAVTTYFAFSICGLVPLIPFLLGLGDFAAMFLASSLLGLAIFFILGVGNGWVLGTSGLVSGIRTLGIGGGAAILAYSAGHLIRLLIEA